MTELVPIPRPQNTVSSATLLGRVPGSYLYLVDDVDPVDGWELRSYDGAPQALWVHAYDRCDGGSTGCVVHNPSAHLMVDWQLHWRADRGLFERLCPCHGVGHPDPDSVRYLNDLLGNEDHSVHGCRGCCS